MLKTVRKQSKNYWKIIWSIISDLLHDISQNNYKSG